MPDPTLYPKLLAMLAAVLFGASAPLFKLLLGDITPVLLAALLYLGCGFGLLILRGAQSLTARHAAKEAVLARRDIPWLVGAIIAGGVAAPVALMIGLAVTPAATASLLLNFEAVATSVIAAVAFKEALGRRIWIAVALITAASIILTWDASGAWGFSPGAAAVVLACVLWGIDNNLTRNISAKDPLSIVTIKGIAAGTVSLVIALSAGSGFPGAQAAGAALALGFVSYGTSIVLFVLAMRSLGAARTSAFFGSAPFVGVVMSLIIFKEWPGVTFALSLPLIDRGHGPESSGSATRTFTGTRRSSTSTGTPTTTPITATRTRGKRAKSTPTATRTKKRNTGIPTPRTFTTGTRTSAPERSRRTGELQMGISLNELMIEAPVY